MASVRIGVLGCADIARRRMLPAMAAADGVEITAIAARDLERAEETARPYGCRAVRGYDALLALPDVDAVYVPLPAALHARWAGAALRAGKHVLAEKPLSCDRGESAGLVELARGKGLALMENVMFVHHPQHAVVRELVADGVIGELRSFRAEFTVPRMPDGDIRHRPELGGGALWDTGVYPVRAAVHFLGDGLRVVGARLAAAEGITVDTAGSALLDTPAGVTAQLTFGLDHGYRSAYELVGSRGRISVDRAFTPPADHRPVLRIESPTGQREITLEAHDQVGATVLAFASAVRAREVPAVRDSLCTAGLLDRIRN
ncbi:Gfo/Idh/MocA family protein [Streptomyces sp. A5-4]|uniref:Gfo/Idh/MocA family protein n=1 Tax=Streptomyces sp. A5-4 TaxID=3384771 RepID=UPI003DA8FAE4